MVTNNMITNLQKPQHSAFGPWLTVQYTEGNTIKRKSFFEVAQAYNFYNELCQRLAKAHQR